MKPAASSAGERTFRSRAEIHRRANVASAKAARSTPMPIIPPARWASASAIWKSPCMSRYGRPASVWVKESTRGHAPCSRIQRPVAR
jgi:hypothetical protein